jgi:hypothetical protein
MQYIQRFSLKPHKAGEFRDWLKKNDQTLREGQPKGWTYLGTWFTVLGFGHYDVEMRYELQDYAVMGTGFGSEALQKAFVEVMDMGSDEPMETYLMKSAEEVRIMEGS